MVGRRREDTHLEPLQPSSIYSSVLFTSTPRVVGKCFLSFSTGISDSFAHLWISTSISFFQSCCFYVDGYACVCRSARSFGVATAGTQGDGSEQDSEENFFHGVGLGVRTVRSVGSLGFTFLSFRSAAAEGIPHLELLRILLPLVPLKGGTMHY
jgi:hypothetical protein